MEQLDLNMDPKQQYRAFAEGEASLPLFLRPWWLDVTSGPDSWNVVLVLKGTEIHAALPFVDRRKMGFRTLSQPPMTPFLGPWLRDTNATVAKTYDRQKELMTALIEGLPPHHHYAQTWAVKITNWLPFFWQRFHQTTLYTYILRGIGDEDAVWKGLKANIKTDVRKAQGRFGIVVEHNASMEDFLALNKRTFARQGMVPPYTDSYLHGIDAACTARACRRIFIARDQEGRAHAGAYVVWDANSAYYLMGGGDPDLRNSGATSLCMWEAICFAATVSQNFDFEGSMIEPIERFFRAFGAEQVPYFKVEKTNSRLYAVIKKLRSLVRR